MCCALRQAYVRGEGFAVSLDKGGVGEGSGRGRSPFARRAVRRAGGYQGWGWRGLPPTRSCLRQQRRRHGERRPVVVWGFCSSCSSVDCESRSDTRALDKSLFLSFFAFLEASR